MSEKKYYWLKLKRDFFKRHDIRIIETMPNGKDYILFYLKLLCESVDHEGNLRFSEQIPYNEDMLATITDTNVDIVRAAIKIFSQLNMMEIMDDGTYYMNEVNRMIGGETEWAEKKRKQRQRKVGGGNCPPNVLTMSDKSKSIEKEIEIDKETEVEKKDKQKEKTPEELLEDVPVIAGSPELKETFVEFIKMRKKIKAPLTSRAMKMIVNETYKLGQGNPDTMGRILNQSIVNDWKGVYALKNEVAVTQKQGETDNPFKDILTKQGQSLDMNIKPDDPLTSVEIAYLLYILKGAYPNVRIKDPQEMINAWLLTFSEHPAGDVFKAARYHMSSNKFFPTPADITECMGKATILYSETASQDPTPKLEDGQIHDVENIVDAILSD